MARSAATRAEPPARRPPPLRAAALCASLVAASAAAQALLPLANYQIIIDRKPFGELAAPRARGQDPDAAQAAQQEQQEREQQALARQIDLVAVNITLRGTISVGFVDKSVKPASSHYLSIGETENGYTVEAADYAAETATISKGGVRITLKLGSGIVSETPDENAPSTTPAAAGAGAPDETAPQPPPRRPTPPNILRRPGMPMRGGYRNTLRERRRAEDEAAEQAEARRRSEDIDRLRHASDSAAARREHDMNFKLLLEGKEPISEINLTHEEEQELISKGLLSAEE